MFPKKCIKKKNWLYNLGLTSLTWNDDGTQNKFKFSSFTLSATDETKCQHSFAKDMTVQTKNKLFIYLVSIYTSCFPSSQYLGTLCKPQWQQQWECHQTKELIMINTIAKCTCIIRLSTFLYSLAASTKQQYAVTMIV